MHPKRKNASLEDLVRRAMGESEVGLAPEAPEGAEVDETEGLEQVLRAILVKLQRNA
jgi:hypothetical protein